MPPCIPISHFLPLASDSQHLSTLCALLFCSWYCTCWWLRIITTIGLRPGGTLVLCVTRSIKSATEVLLKALLFLVQVHSQTPFFYRSRRTINFRFLCGFGQPSIFFDDSSPSLNCGIEHIRIEGYTPDTLKLQIISDSAIERHQALEKRVELTLHTLLGLSVTNWWYSSCHLNLSIPKHKVSSSCAKCVMWGGGENGYMYALLRSLPDSGWIVVRGVPIHYY